ncbi:hypothetical protein FLK61_37340 [Paenalkalicoccus suaedae]|uniref:DUF3221 domain-containing protein n=1 Tax=Paenalkalicoccus suaedae TaxID=2592382 RepID=A0A859FI26_9BACI|nr:hypothetical protein [Paenalkalicoccus suaedae]QKS72302.1 hypothetical protein FLK61_37340 [Paenalkalicoccus suaedae]
MKAIVIVLLMLIVAGCSEQNESDEIHADASSVNGDDGNAPEQVDEEELKVATVLEVHSEKIISVSPTEWLQYEDNPELTIYLEEAYEPTIYDENRNEIKLTDIEKGDTVEFRLTRGYEESSPPSADADYIKIR